MKKIIVLFLISIFINRFGWSQNVGLGTTTPQSKLDINGDLALRSASSTIDSTNNYALDVNSNKQSVYKLKSPILPIGNFTINGITSGNNGRIISLSNRTGTSMQLNNENIFTAEQNRINTGTGATIAVYNGGNVMLNYDTSIQRWVVVAAHNYNLNYFGGGTDTKWDINGNAGTTASNFIGTTDNTPLRFKVNGNAAGIINPLKDNVAFGNYSLFANTTGSNNSALGSYAMESNTTGSNNTAIGGSALYANTTGFKNTATGVGALASNTSGFSNTANGFSAMQSNTIGMENTAIGFSSMEHNTTGSSNSAFGAYALQSNTTGYDNTAVSHYSLSLNTTGYENVGVGNYALSTNTTGFWNTAVGFRALLSNTSANANSAFGYDAMHKNTTGFANSAFGTNALYNNNHDDNIGNSGIANSAFGAQSLRDNTTGWYNAAFGESALLKNTTGYSNSAFGLQALGNNVTGNQNSALGMFSLTTLSSGSNNTAIGSGAMYGPSSGDNNTTVGYGTYSQSSVGSFNTSIGALTFKNNNITTINYCTALGNASGPTANFTNSISIGHDSHSNATDRAEIGSTFMQLIGGYKPWTTLVSDGRFKKNVQPNVKGLDFIMQLQPVTYTVDYHALETFKGIPPFESYLNSNDSLLNSKSPQQLKGMHKMQADKETSLTKAEATIQSGFIAQDVLKAAENVGYDFDGVNKPQHDKDNYSIAYSQFVVPLVKAVQEQQLMITQLQKQNEILMKRIEGLEKK